MSEHFNTHSDLLLKDPSYELTAAFLKAVFSLKVKWDVFRTNRFVEGQPLLGSLECALKGGIGYKYNVDMADPSFFITLGRSYDNYLNTRSGKFRYKLKHAKHKLDSTGDLLFVRDHDCQDFDRVFESILTVEEASWKHKNGTAISSTEKQRRFYKELCGREFKEKRLRFWLLCVNHTPIAYEMGLVNHKKYYSVHGSYNEECKKENPGSVLLARVIEDLIENGIEELDFFGEPFEWQRYWTDNMRWHRSVVIYNHTVKARVFYMFNRLKSKVKVSKGGALVLRQPCR